MGCGCKQKEPVSVFSPIVTIPEPTPTPVVGDSYNINTIEPTQNG